jgi:hypothetical protein
MKKTLILISIAFVLLLTSISVALECDYNPTPVYNPLRPITWNCKTLSDESCFSYITFENDTLIQASPYPTFNEDQTSVREGFACDGICTVEFSTKDLRTDRNLTFSVVCGDESFNATIKPDLNSEFTSEVSMDWAIYLKDNIWPILGIVVVFLVLAILLGLAYKVIVKR